MVKISAIYLVKNEEEFIGKSIGSVIDGVDEVIVVNNRSTDGTMDEVAKCACDHPGKVRVFHHDTDFDASCEFNERNRALGYARYPWVMIVDADQIMSDGWRRAVSPFFKPNYDAIRVKFEHLVGSYEYIHESFYDKQHGRIHDDSIPLFQTMFFRKQATLKCIPASASVPSFRPEHHARFDESVSRRMVGDCTGATVFHYGFAKRNMMYMAEYRIQRGDYGHDPDRKREMIEALRQSGNPFKFIGSVHRVDYGRERVPECMKQAFDNTYRLECDSNGFIQQRYCIKTGKPT